MTKIRSGRRSSTAQDCSVRSLNVYMDSPILDGYGDVTANLVMAEKLKEARPGLRVNIVLSLEALSLLRRIVPSLKPDSRRQTLAGFPTFIERQGNIPAADAAVNFSCFEDHRRSRFFRSAGLASASPIRVGYYELGWIPFPAKAPRAHRLSDGVEPTGRPVDVCDFAVKPRPLSRGGPKAYVQLTSGPGTSGIYISERKPPPPLPLAELARKLDDELPGHREAVAAILSGGALGLAYSKSPFMATLYARAMEKASRRGGLGRRKAVVFVKDIAGAEFPRPSARLEFVPYGRMSLETYNALTYHCTLPILATGDMSMSLAVDFEKCFFYESRPWKSVTADSLAAKMALHPPFRGNARWTDILFQCLLINPKFQVIRTDTMASVIADHAFQRGFRSALAKSRKELALPLSVLRHLDVLNGLDLGRLSPREAEHALQLQHHPKSYPAGIQGLVASACDRSLEPNPRLLALGALISSVAWESPPLLEAYSRVFAEPSARFQYALQAFLVKNAPSDPRIRAVFSRVIETGRIPAVKAAVRVLLSGMTLSAGPAGSLFKEMLKEHEGSVAGIVRELAIGAAVLS